jgi:hypothetical protein
MTQLNDIDIQLIESHLDGLLSAEEQVSFKQRCLRDTAFANHVLGYEQAVCAIKIANRTQLKARLQQHAEQKKAESQPISLKNVPVLRGWIFRFAAAASLLIGGFLFWYFQPKSQNYETAFQIAFQPMPSGGIEKSTNTQLTLLDSAYLAYDNHDWQTAIRLFDALEKSTPQTSFFKANAYLALKDTENALPLLNTLKNNTQFAERQEDVSWLVALCLMKKGDTSNILKISQTPSHLYMRQAKKVLEQL